MANYRSRTERKQAEQKKQRPRERGRSMMKKIVLIMLLIMTIGMFSGVVTFAWMIKDAPPLDETLLRDPLASIVYDVNGQKVVELGQQTVSYTHLRAHETLMNLVWRPPRSTRKESSAASDVYKRQVAKAAETYFGKSDLSQLTLKKR